MLKLDVSKATARVRGRFFGRGSVVAGTIETGCESVTVELTIDSKERAEAVARLARVSEAGCFVLQSMRQPVPVSTRLVHNGEEVELRSGEGNGTGS